MEALLIEPEHLRQELAGLELLVLEERERWISEGPYHHGQSAVVIGPWGISQPNERFHRSPSAGYAFKLIKASCVSP